MQVKEKAPSLVTQDGATSEIRLICWDTMVTGIEPPLTQLYTAYMQKSKDIKLALFDELALHEWPYNPKSGYGEVAAITMWKATGQTYYGGV